VVQPVDISVDLIGTLHTVADLRTFVRLLGDLAIKDEVALSDECEIVVALNVSGWALAHADGPFSARMMVDLT
jgi:hypothetical protein